jgi:hypothetical protein
MEARRLFDNASLGPDALKAVGEAFEKAWSEIERNIGCDQAREAARLKLANALLSVASEDSRDVEVLKKAALQAMAGDYRWQSIARRTEQ